MALGDIQRDRHAYLIQNAKNLAIWLSIWNNIAYMWDGWDSRIGSPEKHRALSGNIWKGGFTRFTDPSILLHFRSHSFFKCRGSEISHGNISCFARMYRASCNNWSLAPTHLSFATAAYGKVPVRGRYS